MPSTPNARWWKPRTVTIALLAVIAAALAPISSASASRSPEDPTESTHAANGPILWTADYETGDVSQWDRIAISGDATTKVVTSPVHSGRYANALTIYNANGSGEKPGVRMVHKATDGPDPYGPKNLPDSGYYSAWYFIPEQLEVTWLNVHQWKQQYDGSARHLYSASMYNDNDGNLIFKLSSSVDGNGNWRDGYTRWLAEPTKHVPIGRWFHLESYYKWNENGNGHITTWLDGKKLWDVGGITTGFDWNYRTQSRQWAVNNYAFDTTPSTFTIYVDDAAMSTQRLGPEWTEGTNSSSKCAGLEATIVGTNGDDVIVGTSGRDVIKSLGGDDDIRSRGGNDVICAGSGNDYVRAGRGRDIVYGGENGDRILGGWGEDKLRGAGGRDVLIGGRKADRLRGGESYDVCDGGPGADIASLCEETS